MFIEVVGSKVTNSVCLFMCCRVAKLIGDKRAVVAERGFNRPYTKIVVTNCGVLSNTE